MKGIKTAEDLVSLAIVMGIDAKLCKQAQGSIILDGVSMTVEQGKTYIENLPDDEQESE